MEILPIFASEQGFIGHRLCCDHGCRKKRHSVSLWHVNRQNSVINLQKSNLSHSVVINTVLIFMCILSGLTVLPSCDKAHGWGRM